MYIKVIDSTVERLLPRYPIHPCLFMIGTWHMHTQYRAKIGNWLLLFEWKAVESQWV